MFVSLTQTNVCKYLTYQGACKKLSTQAEMYTVTYISVQNNGISEQGLGSHCTDNFCGLVLEQHACLPASKARDISTINKKFNLTKEHRIYYRNRTQGGENVFIFS